MSHQSKHKVERSKWKAVLVTSKRGVDVTCEARFWLVGLVRHKRTCMSKIFRTNDPCKCDRKETDLGFTCPECLVNINIPIHSARFHKYKAPDPKKPIRKHMSLDELQNSGDVDDNWEPPEEVEIPLDHIHLDHSDHEKMTLYGTHFSCPQCTRLYKLDQGYLECIVKLNTLDITGKVK